MDSIATIGLWGDGDEIIVIEDAFKSIGVELPVEDAPNWFTVGDLWKSVECKAPEIAASTAAWDRFRQVLSRDTAVDWTRVGMETTLLDGRGGIFRRLFSGIAQLIGVKRA